MIQASLAVRRRRGIPEQQRDARSGRGVHALLQTGMFNLTPEQLDNALAQLEELNPALPALAVNAGFLTDPGYLDFINNPGSEFEPIYGGWNPALVWPGLLELFGVRDEASEIGQVFDSATFDLGAISGGFDASAGST